MERRIALLAHNVRSLWNVGSFFRTGDSIRLHKLYLSGYTGIPPRKEITKTAIGAEQWVPWEQTKDPVTTLQELKKEGFQVIALELVPGATVLSDFHPKGDVCLVVGHELTGVPEDILTLCDEVIAIPMLGKKESLNVAVAAGIAMYALRHAKTSPSDHTEGKMPKRRGRLPR